MAEHGVREIMRAANNERALAARTRAFAATLADGDLARRLRAAADRLDSHAAGIAAAAERLAARINARCRRASSRRA